MRRSRTSDGEVGPDPPGDHPQQCRPLRVLPHLREVLQELQRESGEGGDDDDDCNDGDDVDDVVDDDDDDDGGDDDDDDESLMILVMIAVIQPARFGAGCYIEMALSYHQPHQHRFVGR